MTDELYGRAFDEAGHGFEPLAEPTPAPEPEREYSSDIDGLREAAKDLSETRQTPPLVERAYVHIDGEDAGKQIADNRTIDQKRAVRDLTAIRESEAREDVAESDRQTADAVDRARAAILAQEYQAQQPAEQSAIERQPDAESAAESTPGMDPDIQRALENPKFRQALETELASVETARNHYAEATTQAAQVAAAALYAGFPEISGLTAEQLPVALKIMAQQNPQRHAQIIEHLNHARSLYGAAQQAKAAQRQAEAVRLQDFTEQQDRVFEASIKSIPAETVKQVKSEFLDVAEKHYGIGRKELAHLYQTEPILRSAAFQRVMFDAARYQIAMRGASNPARPPVPSFQRPGVSRPASSGNDSAVSDARETFRENPTPKTAAAYLRARRSA